MSARRNRPDRMTADEVAAAVRLSRAELDRLRAQGDAPLSIVADNGELLTRPADLKRWIDAHEVRPTAAPGRRDIARFRRMRRRADGDQ